MNSVSRSIRVLSSNLTLVLCAGLFATPALRAHEIELPLRRIDFTVERTRDVSNDRITAILRVQLEDADPAKLADRVNRRMERALQRARGRKGIAVSTGGYSTGPIRDRQRITGWRASQELILRSEPSADFGAVSALIGELQTELQLTSVSFDVSDERRREVSDELIVEALKAFRARATLIREQIVVFADRYEIVNLSVQSNGIIPPPFPQHARAMEAAVAAPAFEAGTSTVRIAVSAAIQLD